MVFKFTVPEKKKIRLIINTDCANEADDQFTVAHALLTPKFNVKGIVANHFERRPDQDKGKSMQLSYEEIRNVLSIMNKEDIPVYKGGTTYLDNPKDPIVSEGARFIVEEALKDDPLPLYVINLGSLTDMASAYLLEPKILNKVTAIWIGGSEWPNGGFEFNLMQDIHAANVLFQSKMSFWQIPKNVYKKMRVTLAELQTRVAPHGKIGEYLFKQMVDFNNKHGDNLGFPEGESWVLGDQPAISVLLEYHEHAYDWKPAPLITEEMHYIHKKNDQLENRPPVDSIIKVYNDVDSRMTLEDFYSKLELFYGKK